MRLPFSSLQDWLPAQSWQCYCTKMQQSRSYCKGNNVPINSERSVGQSANISDQNTSCRHSSWCFRDPEKCCSAFTGSILSVVARSVTCHFSSVAAILFLWQQIDHIMYGLYMCSRRRLTRISEDVKITWKLIRATALLIGDAVRRIWCWTINEW